MIERIFKNNLNQTCKSFLTHEESLSASYQGPIRGPNAPKIVPKYFDMLGSIDVCEGCIMANHKCNCGTEFEFDDYDFGCKIKCPNINCNQEYDLECEEIEEETGSWEHYHYLVKK